MVGSRQSNNPALSCPSGDPDDPEAKVFGIVLGTVERPEVKYLERNVDVAKDRLGRQSNLDLAHAFRFHAPCHGAVCGQFSNGFCKLGQAIANTVPPTSEVIPPCTLRTTCRWFHENGVAACYRCAQVTTRVLPKADALYDVVKGGAVGGE